MFKKLALALCLLGLASENASAVTISTAKLKKTQTTIQNVLAKSSHPMFVTGIALVVGSTFASLFGNGKVGKVLEGVSIKK